MSLGYTEYVEPSHIAGGASAIKLVAERRLALQKLAKKPATDMSVQERLNYNDAVDFTHPQTGVLQNLLRDTMRSTRNKVGRKVVVVEGPTGSGKTSLVEQAIMGLIGRNIAQAGTYVDSKGVCKEEQPLVWSLAGSAGQKSYADRLAAGMDLPPLGNLDSNRILDIASKEMLRAKTQIAVIDDLHAMGASGRQDQGTNFLRMLLNSSPTTWIFTTLDLAHGTPVLRPTGKSGDLAGQVIRRNRIVTLASLEPTMLNIRTWNGALSQAVRAVKLTKETPRESLTEMSEWLYTNTNGLVAEMFEVLQTAAVAAVDGEECFTHDLVRSAFDQVHQARAMRMQGKAT